MKKNAGMITTKLSLIFNLVITPSNMRSDKPPADNRKIGFAKYPTNKPMAPKISKVATKVPNFANPKRLNSIFILLDMK